jgi:alkylated DNA repair dioxygenase AlkB
MASAYGCMETVTPDKKRKCINDFFASTTVKKRLKAEQNADTTRPSSVPGLRIIKDFVTEAEEQQLLHFLDAQHWRTDLSRRCMHYGGTYCLMPPRAATPAERKAIESNIIDAPPIPAGIDFIVMRMLERGLYTFERKPEYCIVNEYRDNHGISAHVENFRFGSPVCGLTLSQGDFMRFHELIQADDGSVRSGKAGQAKKTGRRLDVWMPRRSLTVMEGEARERWQHEIVRSRKGRVALDWRRVSLTFRTDKK